MTYHRVRSSRGNSSTIKEEKPVIVKSVSRMKKNEILSAACKNRGLNSTDLGFEENSSRIFLNEHLTPKNNILYKRGRDFCFNNVYKFCWVRERKT